MTWRFEEALEFIRVLESKLDLVGWHCALMGSVLHHGYSSNDLDIIVYPHRTTSQDHFNFRRVMESMGCHLVRDVEWTHKMWKRRYGSDDKKHCEVWGLHGRKIDIFILK